MTASPAPAGTHETGGITATRTTTAMRPTDAVAVDVLRTATPAATGSSTPGPTRTLDPFTLIVKEEAPCSGQAADVVVSSLTLSMLDTVNVLCAECASGVGVAVPDDPQQAFLVASLEVPTGSELYGDFVAGLRVVDDSGPATPYEPVGYGAWLDYASDPEPSTPPVMLGGSLERGCITTYAAGERSYLTVFFLVPRHLEEASIVDASGYGTTLPLPGSAPLLTPAEVTGISIDGTLRMPGGPWTVREPAP